LEDDAVEGVDEGEMGEGFIGEEEDEALEGVALMDEGGDLGLEGFEGFDVFDRSRWSRCGAEILFWAGDDGYGEGDG